MVEPRGIGAVALDEVVGTDDVALRLRHLRLAERHPAVRVEALERLAEPDQPHLVQHLDEEAGVDHVHRRVVDAADVEVDRVPVVDDAPGPTARPRSAGRSSAGSTTPSRRTCPWSRPRGAPALRSSGRRRRPSPRPARAGAGPSAGSPRCPAAAPGARSPAPARCRTLAVHDRDRAAPVALAREAPVAQPVVDGEAPLALRLEPLDDPPSALRRRQAVEVARRNEHLVVGVRDERRALLDLPRAGRTTIRTGSPNACANSKSRSSCAGTAMIAPVP